MRVLLAPAEGLFLNRINFDGYNKKTDIPEKLCFTNEEEQLIDIFRPSIKIKISWDNFKKKNIKKKRN